MNETPGTAKRRGLAVAAPLAGAIAVGVWWAAAEAALVSLFVNRPPFSSPGWFVSFYGCLIFYCIGAATLWVVASAAGALWKLITGGAFSWGDAARAGLVVTGVSATAAAGGFFVGYAVYNRCEPGFWGGVVIVAVAGASFFSAALGVYKLWTVVRVARPALGLRIAAAARLLAGVALAVGAASVVYQRYAAASRPVPAGRPDVVVITIDAWRADALREDVTPNLYAFARDYGVVYEAARAPASWTLPSIAGIFTGSHLATDVRGVEFDRPRRRTLAEVLWAHGYDTFAIIKNPYVDSNRQLLRGFAHYDYADFHNFLNRIHFYDTVWYRGLAGERYREREPGAASAALTAKALAVLRRPARRPKFIWLHYLDPHYPYFPAPEALRHLAPRFTTREQKEVMARGLTPANAPGLHILYEAELKTTDAKIAPLLEALARRRNALVVITADHGEAFAEHGDVAHGRTLYDEVTRVPLVVALPGSPPRPAGAAAPVSLIEVAPSILSFIGIGVPATMEGRDTLWGGTPRPAEDVFIAMVGVDGLMAAAVKGDKKLIMKNTPAGVRWEYYDLGADAGERRPIPLDADGRDLQRRLLRRFGRTPTAKAPALPAGRRAELKALGYN